MNKKAKDFFIKYDVNWLKELMISEKKIKCISIVEWTIGSLFAIHPEHDCPFHVRFSNGEQEGVKEIKELSEEEIKVFIEGEY